MAFGAFGFALRTQHSFHRPIVLCIRKVRHCGSVATVNLPAGKVKPCEDKDQLSVTSQGKCNGDSKAPEWKKLDSKELGITTSMISKPTRVVLSGLKKKGYEVYLVGGCVRDLILKRIPKDFDIITSAELKEVRKTFSRCQIVGKRFPICHVFVNDTIVEVSSFSTLGRKAGGKFNHDFRKPPGCNERDYVRWKNCSQRDFTINGLRT